jgi:hypothetical protein
MQIRKRCTGAVPLLFCAAMLALSAPVGAAVLAEWNFNQDPWKTSQGQGTASLVGVARLFWPSQGAPTDSSPTNNGLGTFSYDWVDRTDGVMFQVNTTGMNNVNLSFDLRPSTMASRYVAVQHTVDGLNWADTVLFTLATARDWYHREVNYSDVTGASDNSKFAVRIVAAVNPSTGFFEAADSGYSFSANGELRYDMVSFTGSAISVPVVIENPANPTPSPSEVPEPSTMLLAGAGMVFLGWVHRKHTATC